MKLIWKILLSITIFISLTLIGWGLYKNLYKQIHWFGVALILIYLITSIVSIIIFSQNRHTPAKLSWLFIITIIPILGPFTYLLFGRRYKNRMSQKDYFKKYNFTTQAQDKSVEDAHISLKNISIYSKRPILKGNIDIKRRIIDSFFEMFDDIKNAKNFIHINYYIIKQSEIWDELKNLLIKKAKQGVEIRIIVDDFGSWALPWYELKTLRKRGIQIEIFNKVRFPFISSQDGFRSHRKYSVIDGNIGYIGGANITDEYVSFDSKYGVWEDAVSKVTGPAVKSFSLLFLNDWFAISKEKLSINKYAFKPLEDGQANMILIEDGPEIEEPILEEVLIKLIYNAKKEIKLSTPYFIPSTSINKALKTAAMAGIKVTIYIPGIWDKRIAFDATRGYATRLMSFGVKFKELNGKFLHSKIGIFDKEVGYIGTSNIDMRSLFSQFENTLFFDGKSVEQLERLFNTYDGNSKCIDTLVLKPKTILKKLRLVILKIIAPMI